MGFGTVVLLDVSMYWNIRNGEGKLTLPRDFLGGECTPESQVCRLDNDPSNQSSHSCDIYKPSKDDRRSRTDWHECQRHQSGAKTHGIPWGSETVAFLEYLRGMAVLAETVESTRCQEDTAWTTADGRSTDDCIDNVRYHGYAYTCKCDHKWRLGSCARGKRQRFIVERPRSID